MCVPSRELVTTRSIGDILPCTRPVDCKPVRQVRRGRQRRAGHPRNLQALDGKRCESLFPYVDQTKLHARRMDGSPDKL